jgi:hypothetical protein
MVTSDYERWWQLHLRVARGETLSAPEQVAYQAGLDQLDQEEAQGEPEGLVALRILRTQIERQTASRSCDSIARSWSNTVSASSYRPSCEKSSSCWNSKSVSWQDRSRHKSATSPCCRLPLHATALLSRLYPCMDVDSRLPLVL